MSIMYSYNTEFIFERIVHYYDKVLDASHLVSPIQ